MMMGQLLPVGTRIRFLKTLHERATGDHPDLIYAWKDSFGRVVGHGCREGHKVVVENYPPESWFGAVLGEEFECMALALRRRLLIVPTIRGPRHIFIIHPRPDSPVYYWPEHIRKAVV